MINRKKLKTDARLILKKNYWKMVIVSLIGFFIMSTHLNISTPFNSLSNYNSNSNITETIFHLNNIDDIEEVIVSNKNISDYFEKFNLNKMINYSPKNKLLAFYYNNIKDNILNTSHINMLLNEIIELNIYFYLIFIVGVIIIIIIQIFIRNILIIGEARFFLECRKYKKTSLIVLLMPYYIKNGFKSGITLFIKSIYQILWNFTIVGGLIKHYSFYLIPFILAENPTIGINESIRISKNLMDGNKWEVFKLDLSFIGLQFLSIFSLGFLSIFYVNPYIFSTKSELYIYLRNKELVKGNYKYVLFDKYLDKEGEYYPTTKYPLTVKTNFQTNSNLNRKYHFFSLCLLFFALSIFGWFWEVSLHIFKYGIFVNRGTMVGPWLPIYGAGAVLMLVIVKKYNKSLIKTFIFCMVLSGIAEYGSATFLWSRFHMKWWDYSNYFLNFNSRIYLEGLIVFAIGGICIIYIVAPALDEFYKRNSNNIKKILIILIIVFTIDYGYSFYFPNTGDGITDYQSNIYDNHDLNP